MFNARTPHARLTVIALVFAVLLASPCIAQQRPAVSVPAASASAPPSAGPVFSTATVPSVSPLEMTRDGSADGASAPDARGRIDAGRLNPAGQIVRMIGALGVVLLLLLGGAHIVRRSPLVTTSGTAAAPQDLSFMGTLKAAFSFLSPFAALSSRKRAGSSVRAIMPASQATNTLAAPSAPDHPGLLHLSGTQPLPGSDSYLYLIQVGTKSLLLGASATGPIQVLGEFSDLTVAPEKSTIATQYEQDEDEAFEALLREEMPGIPEREETRVVQSVVDRLNRTQERLSRHLQDGTFPGQDRLNA